MMAESKGENSDLRHRSNGERERRNPDDRDQEQQHQFEGRCIGQHGLVDLGLIGGWQRDEPGQDSAKAAILGIRAKREASGVGADLGCRGAAHVLSEAEDSDLIDRSVIVEGDALRLLDLIAAAFEGLIEDRTDFDDLDFGCCVQNMLLAQRGGDVSNSDTCRTVSGGDTSWNILTN